LHHWIKDWHLPYLKEAFLQADRVICVSEALRAGLAALLPGMEAKSIVIPNQVDTGYFVPSGHVPDRPPFRLFALAHLTAEKGMDVLIRALHLLQQMESDAYTLRIGGDGAERKKLEQMTQKLGLASLIQFAGRLSKEEVRNELQQAHAFVHPSLMESFGIVLLEAMSCGLPVIATRSGGPEQLVKPELGLLCEAGHAEALAHSIQRIKSDYQAYASDHIRTHIISHYGTKAISRQYLEVYQQILKQ
jgi:glycosyltransferase involved in cell wall biosynthesis